MITGRWWRFGTTSRSDNGSKDRSDGSQDWPQVSPTLLDRPEVREVLTKALESLAPDSRDAFVVHDIHGLSTCETSLVLGISPKSMRQRLRQARLMLKEILASEFKEQGNSDRSKTE